MIEMNRTDQDWEKWGEKSPYFGVLSVPRFESPQMAMEARTEFFASGEEHMAAVLAAIRRREGGVFHARQGVDIGCGVGRLAIPMAKSCGHVHAVDVSPSMLVETSRNRDEVGVTNLDTVLADDELTRVPFNVDLMHSYLVLQHVPSARGRKIIEAMAARVSQGGYIAFQFYVACNAAPLVRALVKLRYLLPPFNWMRNLIRSRPLFEQPMQLHVYPLPSILAALRRAGFSEVELYLDTEDGGNFESVFLLAKRTQQSSSISNPYS